MHAGIQGGIRVFEILVWAALASALPDPPVAGEQALPAQVQPQQSATATDPIQTEPAASASSLKLAALSPVELKILDDITSKTAVSGMPVRLALSRPLYVTSGLGIPEGTAVEGVVIHAAKGGMGGKSGELLIGAKLIRVAADTAIPLRSFKLGPANGRNNETLAFATAVAVGLPALLINGGSARVPAGTVANAKTSAEVEIPVTLLSKLPLQAEPNPPAPAPATQVNSNQGE